jgi:hypothetical protein
MSLARFMIKDPYAPKSTAAEIDELLGEMEGIQEWTIHDNGDVTLEYNRHEISDEIIEEALSNMGFQLKHILDEPYATETEVRQALDK